MGVYDRIIKKGEKERREERERKGGRKRGEKEKRRKWERSRTTSKDATEAVNQLQKQLLESTFELFSSELVD